MTADYYQKNKEVIDQKHKHYNTMNADKVKEWRRNWMKDYRKQHYDVVYATITCNVCGSSIRKDKKSRHEQTKKHLQALEQL